MSHVQLRILLIGSNSHDRASGIQEDIKQLIRDKELENVIVDRLSIARDLRSKFYDNNPDDKGNANVPIAVLVGATMRQYGPDEMGMDVSIDRTSLLGEIEQLCETHNIPMIRYHYPIPGGLIEEQIDGVFLDEDTLARRINKILYSIKHPVSEEK